MADPAPLSFKTRGGGEGGGGGLGGVAYKDRARLPPRGAEILPTSFFFAQFEVLPAPCAASLVVVARYCCTVVGSPSVCHVRSSCSLGSENMVVVKNVRGLPLGAKKKRKKAAFFLRLRVSKFPTSDGPAPKLEVRRTFALTTLSTDEIPPVCRMEGVHAPHVHRVNNFSREWSTFKALANTVPWWKWLGEELWQGVRAPLGHMPLTCSQCSNRPKDDKLLHTNPNLA